MKNLDVGKAAGEPRSHPGGEELESGASDQGGIQELSHGEAGCGPDDSDATDGEDGGGERPV
jgi:hypothetical protein